MIIFYALVLFQTIGLGSDALLLIAVITGLINILSTLLAIGQVWLGAKLIKKNFALNTS